MWRAVGVLVEALRHDVGQGGAHVFSATGSFAHGTDELVGGGAGGEISGSSRAQYIDSTGIFRMMTKGQHCQTGMNAFDVSQDMKPVFRPGHGQINDEVRITAFRRTILIAPGCFHAV